jgi:hypothetical protein
MTPASSRSTAAPGVLVAAALLVASLALAPPVFAQVADTTLWGPNNTVTDVVVANGRVYTWGNFTAFRGAPCNRLASLDVTTGRLTDWNPDPDTPPTTLAVGNDTIYVGGWFSTMGGVSRPYLAAFDAATGALADYPAGVGAGVDALAAGGGYWYWSSSTSVFAMRGSAVKWTAALNSVGRLEGMLLVGARLYVYGTFLTVNGTSRTNAAALNALTGALLSWSPNPNNIVYALAARGGVVYLGGSFNQVGPVTQVMRNKLAAVDTTAGNVTAWNPGAGGAVKALAVASGIVYVGGSFTAVDGASRNNVAAISESDGSATSWDANAGSLVNSIALDGAAVYLAGNFASVCGQDVRYLARMPDSPSPTLLAYFDAEPAAEGVRLRWDFSAAVEALAVERRDLAAGAWAAVPVEIVADAEGSEALDRTAEPGHDYEYRLVAALGGGAEATFGPVAVSVPAAIAASGLVRVAPNPVERAARVVFESARTEPVRLDVLDPAGRTVAVLFEGTAAPGRHEATWDVRGVDRGLAPGVYVVRLRTPGGTTWRRVAFVR